jgi:long-subunit acyl-CoA synthetase (AMP-forming)
MSLFIGARVGIGRELGDGCSHQELLCDLAGVQPTCFFAFSYLWSELHAVFNRELENITISQACEILESKTPAAMSANVEQVHDNVLSDFQVALRQQSIAPALALRVISPPVSLHLGTTAPEATSAVQQLLQSKQTFVKHAAEIIGSRELLLSNWFQRMGGRVLAAVTGGGHTSEEVLSWMQVLMLFRDVPAPSSAVLPFCRPSSDSKRLSIRSKRASGKTRTALLNFRASV